MRWMLEVAGVTILMLITHLMRRHIPGIGDYLADMSLLLVAYGYGAYMGHDQTIDQIWRRDKL